VGSAAVPSARARTVEGALLGLAGVVLFSFSFPATKLALRGFDPWFISFGRAVLAAALAAPTLWLRRARLPTRAQWVRLAVVAAGVVVGFPIMSSIALQHTGSAHGAIVVALLPAGTAIAADLRAGERPGPVFWLAAVAGVAVVTAFAIDQAGGSVSAADGLLFASVWVCGIGYAEGGAVSRDIGAVETISWALVLSLPATVPVALLTMPAATPSAAAVFGFVYVGAFSMFLGFLVWYAGLARGGVARIGQLQLFQPLITVGWSALVLGEAIGWTVFAAGLGVIACVAVTQRARVAVRT